MGVKNQGADLNPTTRALVVRACCAVKLSATQRAQYGSMKEYTLNHIWI